MYGLEISLLQKRNYLKYHVHNNIFHVYTNYFILVWKKEKNAFITLMLTNLDLKFSVEEYDKVFGIWNLWFQ